MYFEYVVLTNHSSSYGQKSPRYLVITLHNHSVIIASLPIYVMLKDYLPMKKEAEKISASLIQEYYYFALRARSISTLTARPHSS